MRIGDGPAGHFVAPRGQFFGYINQTEASAGRISVCWISTCGADPWGVRGSVCPRDHSCSAIKKTACSTCGQVQSGWYDRKVRSARDLACGGMRIFLEFEVRRINCRHCGKVKRERLDFPADNPFYTKRFAFDVGRRCRSSTNQDVATALKLDWQTVKELDKQYMYAQLAKVGTPGPRVIGIDEVSIRKGHDYRIVVSDLLRERPIWFGGTDRSEASMAQFYQWLGKKSRRTRLAVMDMWKPFRTATHAHGPQAAILFDKFHIIRHLGEALENMHGSPVGSVGTSRAKSTRCCHAKRTSPWKVARQ